MAPALGVVRIDRAVLVECSPVSGLFMQPVTAAGPEGFRMTRCPFRLDGLFGLATVLCRSPISLCHLGFEFERADAAQI